MVLKIEGVTYIYWQID
jgi:hypothetical protein